MPLPNIQVQQDNAILWFGENIKMGESSDIQPNLFQSIMGAENVSGCVFILKHLHDIPDYLMVLLRTSSTSLRLSKK